MYGMLADARGVWMAVVQDLLSVTPNSAVKKHARDATGAQLRSLALRFNWVDKAWSSNDLSRVFTPNTIPISPPLLDAALIQGSTILVHVTTVASVHMTSSLNGESILAWYSPEQIVLADAYIMLYCSPTIGMILMIRIVTMTGGRRLWLFRVTTTNPSLVQTFDSGGTSSIIDASVYDDTVVAVRDDIPGASIALLNIPSLFLGQPKPPIWFCLPEEVPVSSRIAWPS
jgi:hypothetical protein